MGTEIYVYSYEPLTLVLCLYAVQEMLKCSKGEGTVELEEALATMLDIIKSVNDSMHQIAITGFEVRAPGYSFPLGPSLSLSLSLSPSLAPSLAPSLCLSLPLSLPPFLPRLN